MDTKTNVMTIDSFGIDKTNVLKIKIDFSFNL
jgi:hypothetical protein